MASAAGLEPTTHSLGNCCSILMSYAAPYISYIQARRLICKQNFRTEATFFCSKIIFSRYNKKKNLKEENIHERAPPFPDKKLHYP